MAQNRENKRSFYKSVGQQGGQKRGERFLKKKQRRASTLSSLNLMKERSKASQ
jgi:hypothetical protein